jgi:hypothetical protein
LVQHPPFLLLQRNMQHRAHKMLTKSQRNFGANSVDATFASPAQEMRHIVGEAVNARRDNGQSEAVFQAARELRLSTRRILGIMRGEVARVWADELDHARNWRVQHYEKQAAVRAQQAETYRLLSDVLREKIANANGQRFSSSALPGNGNSKCPMRRSTDAPR